MPEEDEIGLAMGPLNFAKKRRGKRDVTPESWVIPKKLTKRITLGKVAELFDLCGLVTPITAGLKLDLRDLVDLGCDWDDEIPDVNRETWINNFKLIEQLGDLNYSRVVIPKDAESLDIMLIGAGDASAKMTCAGCYARLKLKLKNNKYSCQLILGKSKIVPEGMSLPRAELYASVLNTHITEIVKKALKSRCTDHVLVTDSEIALHWLCSDTKQLKPWTRNKVIEINRFSSPDDWYHVESAMNPAYIGYN